MDPTNPAHVGFERAFNEVKRDLDDARRRLAEASNLLAEEFEVSLCMEAPPGSQITDCFCIDLTDPNGKPTCLPCRARAFLEASTPTAEPPRDAVLEMASIAIRDLEAKLAAPVLTVATTAESMTRDNIDSCETWCSTPGNAARGAFGIEGRWCSVKCMDAGRPLNPQQHHFADCIGAEGDKPCKDCVEYALDAVGASRPTALDAATGKWEACEDCDGVGRKNHRGDVGELVGFVTSSECPTCKGTGTRRAEGVKNSESPPPAGPTGMKPGQRCTRPTRHTDDHRHSATADALWVLGELDRKIGRCPYIAPPAGPVCASDCGRREPIDKQTWWKLGKKFCSEACYDAGRPLHPEVPHGT